jgi:hypothetical protein
VVKHTGYVYFVGVPHCDEVKIGFTAGSPHERCRQLQTGNPHPLEVLCYFPGNPEDEKQMHAEFKADRIHGEWFRKSAALSLFMLGVRLANRGLTGEVQPSETPLGISIDELEEIANEIVSRRSMREAETEVRATIADGAWPDVTDERADAEYALAMDGYHKPHPRGVQLSFDDPEDGRIWSSFAEDEWSQWDYLETFPSDDGRWVHLLRRKRADGTAELRHIAASPTWRPGAAE